MSLRYISRFKCSLWSRFKNSNFSIQLNCRITRQKNQMNYFFCWRQVASRTPEELWSAEGNAKSRSRLSRPSSVKVWTFTFLLCLTKAEEEKWFELLHCCFVSQKLNRMARKEKLDSNLALYLHKKTVDRNQSVTLKKISFFNWQFIIFHLD